MKQGGRPRREDEQPDSPFGEALKEHLQRVKITQAQLAKESLVAEKTISAMVKGKRSSNAPMFRHDVREIIKVLHRKGALCSLKEANEFIATIPAVSKLDERDLDDLAIINLFKPVENETQAADQSHMSVPPAPLESAPADQESRPASVQTPPETFAQTSSGSPPSDQASTLPLNQTPPETSTDGPEAGNRRDEERNRGRQSWLIGTAAVLLLALLLGVLFKSVPFPRPTPPPETCPDSKNGVTLYTDPYFQGHCHTFPPGDYDLSQFGLDQNVSSLKDPDAAYAVRLVDRSNRPGVFDKDVPQLPADWNDQAHSLHVEKHRPTACQPGTDGIIAFIDTDYSGGCLFLTKNIPDLAPLNFDQVIVSIQFVGAYQNTRQLVLYRQSNYQDECGAYWQDQSDLLQCARIALSVRVLPFTPPTPIPTAPGTRAAGNVAPLARLSPAGAYAVVDGNLQTEWIGGHMVEMDLRWAFPITIHRVVVWDRRQSTSDNNQINKLKLSFSDGTSTGSLDMISQGPRCADVIFPTKTITWLHIIPVDASGNNGLREVEVWATTGSQYSKNTCVNKKTVIQTIPA
jgi:transcriptional regulator with XRE-family HTH domain